MWRIFLASVIGSVVVQSHMEKCLFFFLAGKPRYHERVVPVIAASTSTDLTGGCDRVHLDFSSYPLLDWIMPYRSFVSLSLDLSGRLSANYLLPEWRWQITTRVGRGVWWVRANAPRWYSAHPQPANGCLAVITIQKIVVNAQKTLRDGWRRSAWNLGGLFPKGEY